MEPVMLVRHTPGVLAGYMLFADLTSKNSMSGLKGEDVSDCADAA
jgi:hypothetical protein